MKTSTREIWVGKAKRRGRKGGSREKKKREG